MPHPNTFEAALRRVSAKFGIKIKTKDERPRRTYSQLGEDICIIHHLGAFKGGRYVDVGCHYPYRFSNTALLHTKYGWSGINIDADSRAIDAFRAARPKDVNLNLAVGLDEGDIDFAVFAENAVNSAVPEDYEAKRGAFGDPVMHRVPMLTLQTIVDSHIPAGETFDFLNVDVEGLDLQVLQSLDWAKHQPQVVAVEIHGLNLGDPSSSPTVRFMQGLGYRLGSFVVMTAIFVR